MNVTPTLRRAVHQAVDLILDALAEPDAKPKRRRGPRYVDEPPPPLPPGTTAEDIARIDAKLRKAGFRPRRPTT